MNAAYLPKILKIGGGAINELVAVLAELGLSQPLIVSDPFIASSGYLDKLTQPLQAANFKYSIFSDCVPDPTTDSVAAGLTQWRNQSHDCLVALGGGSSMDTAKAIAVLAKHGGKMRDYKAPNPVPEGFPVIAIPTTAGTGSEATRVTVVTDVETEEKMMCLGLGLLPTAALVDYELTLTMPYRLTADTGLDTLCHALEAYVSRKAHAFTDPIALDCLKTVAKQLPIACAEPENHEARKAMMLAATQGGIAFSNASVTLIHGMSRPLGAAFHIPHGMSNAMLLPNITEYSLLGASARYAEAARVMAFANASDDDSTACNKLIDSLYKLCEDLDVPSFSGFGVEKSVYFELIERMSEQALASGSPNNNPVVPDLNDLTKLYEQVWC